MLDESAPMESDPGSRYEAYCYAKVKQDELLMDYGRTRGLKYVLLRPGVAVLPVDDDVPAVPVAGAQPHSPRCPAPEPAAAGLLNGCSMTGVAYGPPGTDSTRTSYANTNLSTDTL